MCCTVRGDLLGAFASVMQKMKETNSKGVVDGNGSNGRGSRALDSVLVETTGMADPVPIVRTLLQVIREGMSSGSSRMYVSDSWGLDVRRGFIERV